MRLVLHVPGARSLKDGRQVSNSVRDRVRARFDVSVHEIEAGEVAGRRALLITTGGDDARLIRATLDRIRSLVESNGNAIVVDAAIDVFPWGPPDVPFSV